MTLAGVFGTIIVCLIYLMFIYLFGGCISDVFEDWVYKQWEKSEKTKYDKLVKTLYICENNLDLYDHRHPKWYKALQLLVGILWPVWFTIGIIVLPIYWLFWYFIPKVLYQLFLKPCFMGLYCWWVGKEYKSPW